jgi:hypothetical protein
MLDSPPEASPLESLSAYLDRWAAAHLSCKPADREMAENGVRLAYAAAGLKPPSRIVWCRGPMEIARRLGVAGLRDRIGANVKAELFDRISGRIGTFGEVFWKEVVVAATRLSDRTTIGAAAHSYGRCKAVSGVVNRVVGTAVDEYLSSLSIRSRHAWLRMRGLPRLLPRWSFNEAAVGPHDLASLGVYEYLHDVVRCQEFTQPMRGLWAIVKSAGWIVPHQHVCWISERPELLSTDARARLHSAEGPALRYRDGWSAYAWKGVEVPGWMIEHPELITPALIADTFDPVRRNCMIEIMTPERFVKTGTVDRVAEDEAGILWRKFWSFRGVTLGSWSAVEVVDGTAKADEPRRRYFLRVPSSMRSPREAVAWTYGLTEQQYGGLQLRT